ncbi:hypothetical protein [Parasphingorhabdus sp.]|uniref:hypothetical protein n=1 Tax=Parasphingorhabdus sp. TaxID=2709688 RepID=UPI003298AA89
MAHRTLHQIVLHALMTVANQLDGSYFELPQNVYCDSYDGPYIYALVDDADDIRCTNYKRTNWQCFEKGEKPPEHACQAFDDEKFVP